MGSIININEINDKYNQGNHEPNHLLFGVHLPDEGVKHEFQQHKDAIPAQRLVFLTKLVVIRVRAGATLIQELFHQSLNYN